MSTPDMATTVAIGLRKLRIVGAPPTTSGFTLVRSRIRSGVGVVRAKKMEPIRAHRSPSP